MGNNTVIIFCQAPADVPFVLSLYEKKQKTNSVSIFVVNVEGVFRFLSSLKLNLEQLAFIPYSGTNLKNIKDIYLERKRINALFKKYFSSIESAEIYFYSRFEDWLTSAFIHKLSKVPNVKITYLKHHDDSVNFDEKAGVTLRLHIYSLILKYITGVTFTVKILERLPEFPVDKYAIQKGIAIIDKEVFSKYVYRENLIDKKKANVLFFVSDCQDLIFERAYYYNAIIDIVSVFQQNGYRVILKGHPRIGIPDIFREAADSEIPGYVPGEFIDADSIAICIGLETNALSHFAKNESLPTYSLVRMIPSANDRQIEIFVDYLKKQSENKIRFIDNKQQLIEVAKYTMKDVE